MGIGSRPAVHPRDISLSIPISGEWMGTALTLEGRTAAQSVRILVVLSCLFASVAVAAWYLVFHPMTMTMSSPEPQVTNDRLTFALIQTNASMWSLMVLAMMLPMAIFEIARSSSLGSQDRTLVSEMSFLGGFVVSSVGFALSAAICQLILAQWPGALFSGTGIAFIGVYQLTAYRVTELRSCSKKPRRLDAVFYSRSQNFKKGIAYCRACLKCCGPAMASQMFVCMSSPAVSISLFLWMLVEHAVGSQVPSTRISGICLVAYGTFVAVSARVVPSLHAFHM